MNAAQKKFLYSLLEAASPSGFEGEALKVVKKHASAFADEINVDVHGNIIACVNPKGRLRLMLAGHIDEIGLIVTHIDDSGFIYFTGVGGHDQLLAAGMRVKIFGAQGPVMGVIGKKPIHLMSGDERNKAPMHKDMWIDIGVEKKKQAEKLVAVGDIAMFDVGVMEMQGKFVAARGMDDRIGTFTVMEALRMISRKRSALKDVAVYAVGTVQEEIGLRGARTSAFGIDPHVGIAVDVGFATDFPGIDKKEVGEARLGKGPMLHRGPNINVVVEKLLLEVARRHKIPYQVTAEPRATGTDANAIQVNRSGVAAGLVSIPNRYMHTPVEVVNLDDVENSAKLLAEFAFRITPRTSFIPA
ncbi:MAG: M42 family metallopeptidase [Planctomycetes bacterium]|nr:M42 family metallopeptidase [Planctomycetota bacterium]